MSVCARKRVMHKLALELTAYIDSIGGHTTESYPELAARFKVPVWQIRRAAGHSRTCDAVPTIPYRGPSNAYIDSTVMVVPDSFLSSTERDRMVGQGVSNINAGHLTEVEAIAKTYERLATQAFDEGNIALGRAYTTAATEYRINREVSVPTKAAIAGALV